ncbi:CLUMA_CG018857, isoform A [Clunio marinus]|uniref:Carbonic anhydrase n=1 Tax=Clunio marinus TaxID=568069 RepID=A0A1J1J2Y5_9DIPT|nr:CLUMA_CG018857, isoform A [Clunio marinus]
MIIWCIGIILCFCNAGTFAASYAYDYNPGNSDARPEDWAQMDSPDNAQCGWANQSPIDLQTQFVSIQSRANSLSITNLRTMPENVVLTNVGHGAEISFEFANNDNMVVTGGPLNDQFIVAQAQWHWGTADCAGSEHMLNSQRYSAEVHIVTYNSKYASLGDAADKFDGLAVLGFLYELDDAAAPDFPSSVQGGLGGIPNAGDTTTVAPFALINLFRTEFFDYIAYSGSLTTPPCYQTVQWMVSTKPLKISSADLGALRSINDVNGSPLLRNFRPCQNSYSRALNGYYL